MRFPVCVCVWVCAHALVLYMYLCVLRCVSRIKTFQYDAAQSRSLVALLHAPRHSSITSSSSVVKLWRAVVAVELGLSPSKPDNVTGIAGIGVLSKTLPNKHNHKQQVFREHFQVAGDTSLIMKGRVTVATYLVSTAKSVVIAAGPVKPGGPLNVLFASDSETCCWVPRFGLSSRPLQSLPVCLLIGRMTLLPDAINDSCLASKLDCDGTNLVWCGAIAFNRTSCVITAVC